MIPTLDYLRAKIEEKKKDQQSHSKLDKIRKAVYFLTCLLFALTVGREILNASEKKEEKQAQEHIANRDSVNTDTLKSNLRQIPIKIDSSTETIKGSVKDNKDSIISELRKRKNIPVDLRAKIDLSPLTVNQLTNPFIIQSNDTTSINIGLENYGNSTAKNIVEKNMSVGHIGNRRFFITAKYSLFNKGSTIIPISQRKTEEAQMISYYDPKNMEDFFFAFKLKYTNENGKNNDSLFKIWYVNKTLIRESSSHEYDSINNILIEKNF